MPAKARQILMSELALAEKTDEEKASHVLDEVLASELGRCGVAASLCGQCVGCCCVLGRYARMMESSPDVAVVIVAAGSGTRLGHPTPKAFVLLSGRTLLEHAVLAALGMRHKPQVIVVVGQEHIDATRQVLAGASTPSIVVTAGASTRQGSVARGLDRVSAGGRTGLVHDAARPLAPPPLFDEVVAAVRARGRGIVPALDVADTIKRVNGHRAVVATVDRSELVAVQTPQGFPRDHLIAAYAVAHEDYTDDAAVMAAAGHPVDVIAGDPAAFKITTPADLRRAMTWDAAGDGSDIMNVDSDTFSRILNTVSADSSVSVPRVGTGIDSHAFAGEAEDVPLWVAGLHWPGHRGLSGHSDGDVAVHAICDALLAAAGLGDLGSNFGTAEPQLRGAAGEYFLRETVARTRAAGYRIGNVSV